MVFSKQHPSSWAVLHNLDYKTPLRLQCIMKLRHSKKLHSKVLAKEINCIGLKDDKNFSTQKRKMIIILGHYHGGSQQARMRYLKNMHIKEVSLFHTFQICIWKFLPNRLESNISAQIFLNFMFKEPTEAESFASIRQQRGWTLLENKKLKFSEGRY